MPKKNFGVIIFIVLVGVILFFAYSGKKEAPTGAGFGYWSAQEFTTPTNIIKEIRLSIKNNVASPSGGIDVYIAKDKNVSNPNILVYSFTHFDDSQIQGTGDFYNKTYNINDAEVTTGETLYLVTHVIGDDDYAVMTNQNFHTGKFYHSFDGKNWLNNWLEVYDLDFDVIISGSCGADTSCNGCIENPEFTTYKSRWLSFDIAVGNTEYTDAKSKWIIFEGC